MQKFLHTMLVAFALLMPLSTNAQTSDSMLVNVAVNETTMGTTIPAPGVHYFHMGDTCSVLAVPNTGYVLTGWNIQMYFLDNMVVDTTFDLATPDVFDLITLLNNGNPWVVGPGHGNYSFNVTANFVDEGLYVPDSMVVNVAVNNPVMGTTIPAPGTHHFAEGDTASVIATAYDGYHLTGWTIQASIGNTMLVDTTVNISMRDVFDLFSLLNEIRNGMTIAEMMELMARPVNAWIVDPLYAQATVNVTANFAAGNPDSIMVFYEVNNPSMGTTIPAPGTHYTYVGDAITASATANDGYEQTAWIIQYYIDTVLYGQLFHFPIPGLGDTVYADDPDFSSTMNFGSALQQVADTGLWINIIAVFAPLPMDSVYYTVSVNYDANMGTVDGIPTEDVLVGTTITLTATAREGYRFAGWTITPGYQNIVTDNPLTITVTQEMSITALFEQQNGIDDVNSGSFQVYSVDNKIVVKGAGNMPVSIYDVTGRSVYNEVKASEIIECTVTNIGEYMVKVGTSAANHVVVVR